MKSETTVIKYDKQMFEVAQIYKRALAKLLREGKSSPQDNMLFDPEENYSSYWSLATKEYSDDQKVIAKINFILASLESAVRDILWNEFFFQIDKFWWMRKYSRSTFYRLRKQAVNKFMALYE